MWVAILTWGAILTWVAALTGEPGVPALALTWSDGCELGGRLIGDGRGI